jgi:hypothetical protein
MNLPAEMAFVKLVSLSYEWNGTEWVIAKGTEEQNQEDDDWIQWNGGDCPVEEGTLVAVELRNGTICNPMLAERFWWNHFNRVSDIVAYRLSK